MIAGELRGRKLLSVPGRQVRPTSDKVREALFSILGDRVAGAFFADLFAGSGAVGIEALSRGAHRCTFVEAEGEVVTVLERNIDHCALGSRTIVRRERVERFLTRGELAGEPGALIFLDPPYSTSDGRFALAGLGAICQKSAGALIIYEHSSRIEPEAVTGLFERFRTAVYGDTALSFYR